MKYSKVLLPLLTAIIFAASPALYSQKFDPKIRKTEPDHTISSKITGRDYQLYISLPRSYDSKGTTKYPVLYVLDGETFFPLFKTARELMDFGNELEEVIIVGIGSGTDLSSWFINRTYDFTPSLDTADNRRTERNMGFPTGTLSSGGAPKFLKCIQTEIIPFVDEHYHTTPDRGLTGHSLGGLFSAYCFLNSNGYFSRFGINSPSINFNNNDLLNQAASFFKQNATWEIPPTKVFISAGEKEGPDFVTDQMIRFTSLLEARAYKNVLLQSYLFPGETHFSVMPANMTKTLAALYGKKRN
jgi:predicted alpha/beta superfamily hydrolase